MKTLVTGGTGFLGSHCVDRLIEQGHQVRALARKSSDLSYLKTTGAEIVFGEVEDYESLVSATRGVDIVFHAAARVSPGWGTWQSFENTIIKGTENLLNASIESGVNRFVYVSSGTVVGKAAFRDTPADESADYEVEFSTDAYYDYAKMEAEKIALDYHRQGKIWATVVRPCMIYGPRCRLLTDRMYLSVKLFPVLPGKADAKIALVYVTDVADCIIAAATHDKSGGEIYNIAPTEVITFRDLYNSMSRAIDRGEIKMHIPLGMISATAALMEGLYNVTRSKEPPFLTRADIKFIKDGMNIDNSKARRELGWKPKISLDEGTKLYVEWRKAQAMKKKRHC